MAMLETMTTPRIAMSKVMVSSTISSAWERNMKPLAAASSTSKERSSEICAASFSITIQAGTSVIGSPLVLPTRSMRPLSIQARAAL